MIIFPAIDLHDGNCVRLLHGDPNIESIYSEDPGAMAQRFAEQGAEWLHVVNLDGAFGKADRAQTNYEAIQLILDQIDIPIQLGGGIRSIEAIKDALDLGVSRVILGTMAVERPRQILDIIARFGPDQIVVGIDARDGKVATHGWKTITDVDAVALGKEMSRMGVQRIVYTDINRDGALTGINIKASQALAQAAGLKVIISGGVALLDDVYAAKGAFDAEAGIEGLIVGRALYAGTIDLRDALQVARE